MKQRNLKTRTDKIKFLKELEAGKAKINELLPFKIEVWLVEDDGTHINRNTGKRLTLAEYNADTKRRGIKESDIIRIGTN